MTIKTTETFLENSLNEIDLKNINVETNFNKLLKKQFNVSSLNSTVRKQIFDQLNALKKNFATIKNNSNNFRIITVNKSNGTINLQQKSYTINSANRPFSFNTFITGGVSRWVSNPISSLYNTKYENNIFGNTISFDWITNQVYEITSICFNDSEIQSKNKYMTPIEKNFIKNNKNLYAYLSLTNQNNLKVLFTKSENQQLKEQHEKILNLIKFTSDVVFYEDCYHLIINDKFLVTNIFGTTFHYKQSQKIQDMLYTQQITIDIDFHDETDINVIQEKKLEIIKKVKDSDIFPYIENSLRGIHLVFVFDTKLNSYQVDLISALLRLYLIYELCIEEVDNNAVGAMRLTREIYGVQRGEINKKVYVTFNAPIAYDNHYFNYDNLMNFLLDFSNKNKLNLTMLNAVKHVLPKRLHKSFKLTDEQKQLIQNIINPKSSISNNNSPLQSLKQKQQQYASELVLNDVDLEKEQRKEDYNYSNEQNEINLILMERRIEILSDTTLKTWEKYQELNPVNVRFMLNNPILVNDLKSDLLKAFFYNDWDYLNKIMDFPIWDPSLKLTDKEGKNINLYTEYGNINTDYAFHAVKHYFYHTDFLDKLLDGFEPGKTISSPFYTDETPSFFYNNGFFTHFSGKPSGDYFTLTMWMIASANVDYYRELSVEDAQNELTIDTVLALSQAIGIPVYKPLKTSSKKEAFIEELYKQEELKTAFLQINADYKNHVEAKRINNLIKEGYKPTEKEQNIIKKDKREIKQLTFNHQYIEKLKDNNDYHRYKQFAEEIYSVIQPKGLNHTIMKQIINYVIANCFIDYISIKKASTIKKDSTKKAATTNLYELQTLLFVETIENDLNIKHSTIVNYLRYLFAIHFFERQVHIDNVDSKFDEYKKNKHARHYLANFISLSNFNLFAVNIIDNANKIKEYIENNKEQRKLIRQSIRKEINNSSSSSKVDIKEKIKKALTEEKTLQNKKVITKLNIIDYVDVFGFNYVKQIFPVGLILYSFKKKDISYTMEMEEYVERHQILHDLTKNNNMQVLNRKLNCRTDVSLYVNDTFSTNRKENRQIKKAFKDRITALIDRVYRNSEDLYFDKPCFFVKSATTNNENIFNLSWLDIEKEINIDNQKFYVENFYSNIRGKSTYMICLQNNLKRAKDLLKINSIVINKNTNELISNNNQFVFLQRRLLISNIINNADLIAA